MIISKKMLFVIVPGILCLLTSFVMVSMAAEPNVGLSAISTATEKELPFKVHTNKPPFNKSLLFEVEQLRQIQYAIDGYVMALGRKEAAIPATRLIKLAGVIYKSTDNWVIWLNGRRVTPDRLLPEIVDIRVRKNKVYLKWFDKGLRDVILITLKPHHTYDIGAGILLPG